MTSTPIFPPVNPDKLSITSIKLLGATISSNSLENSKSIDDALALPIVTEYQTEISTKNMVSIPNKQFTSLLTIKLEGIDANKNKIGINGEFQLEIKIKAEDLDLYILPSQEKDGKHYTVIHNTLTGSMMAIAYSTSRGIVFMRTLGTALEGVILPIIDPLKIPGVVLL